MRRRRRMGDEAFRIAEIVGNGDEGKPVADGIGRRLAASNFKGNEGAAARHLPLDDHRPADDPAGQDSEP